MPDHITSELLNLFFLLDFGYQGKYFGIHFTTQIYGYAEDFVFIDYSHKRKHKASIKGSMRKNEKIDKVFH